MRKGFCSRRTLRGEALGCDSVRPGRPVRPRTVFKNRVVLKSGSGGRQAEPRPAAACGALQAGRGPPCPASQAVQLLLLRLGCSGDSSKCSAHSSDR